MKDTVEFYAASLKDIQAERTKAGDLNGAVGFRVFRVSEGSRVEQLLQDARTKRAPAEDPGKKDREPVDETGPRLDDWSLGRIVDGSRLAVTGQLMQPAGTVLNVKASPRSLALARPGSTSSPKAAARSRSPMPPRSSSWRSCRTRTRTAGR